MIPVSSEDEPSGLIAIVGAPMIVAAGIYILHFLPNEALTILTAWILASFPVGVLAGHCVLSEE